MLIRETFATRIEERINPVVKVSDRQAETLLQELGNLIVTPQWEQYFATMLDEYANAFDRDDEQNIGIWISGFFGSGKSLLMKTLGVLLEGGELRGNTVHDLFLGRIPSGPQRSIIERSLHTCRTRIKTTYIGSNLFTYQATSDESLALIAFKMFAEQQGYTRNWPFAWAIEHQLALGNHTQAFRTRACELIGLEWDEITQDPAFYNEQLYEATMAVLPQRFHSIESVERAVRFAYEHGIEPRNLVQHLRDWCTRQDGGGRRYKLLLEFDELGQWINSGTIVSDRLMKIQALVEAASTDGGGRIWIAATAHGDVHEYSGNVQQLLYAQINQRFALKCRLSNEDINLIVQERVLRKTQEASSLLRERFRQRSGEIADLANLQARRQFGVTTAESVSQFYPYLPWTVDVIPEIVKTIAHAVGRDDALSGSNRTLIGVIQGGILDTPNLLAAPVGRLLCLADLYRQIEIDIPVETKTDLGQILAAVTHANDDTLRVAHALYLLGQVEHIDCTVENINRALANSLKYQLGAEREKVERELNRLVEAGFAKRVGNLYSFLTRQQRTFHDRVRARQEDLLQNTHELSQRLKQFDGYDSLRFDRVQLGGTAGSEKLVRLEMDDRLVRNKDEAVTVSVYSSLQYLVEADVRDDTIMQQRSKQNPHTIFFRMENVPALRRELAYAVATDAVADEALSAGDNPDKRMDRDIAQKAKQEVKEQTEKEILRLLAEAVRQGKIFWNGTAYTLIQGENPQTMVRNTLSHILTSIYARFREVPRRILNEEAAVKAALANNTTNSDLEALGVFKADGTLNDSHPLISSLRGELMQTNNAQGFIEAERLRTHFSRPPFGWDGQCIKVGLALLLRAGGCRLIVNGGSLTNPEDPEVQLQLTKEQKFRALRVQVMIVDLELPQLYVVRNAIETIFGEKPTLTSPMLNMRLSVHLTQLHQRANDLRTWSALANCPLPLSFESGESLIAELMANAVPSGRLRQFMDSWQAVLAHKQLLDNLARYQQEHGPAYGNVRDFYNQMVNVQLPVSAIQRFIADWQTVTQVERTVTDATRWKQIMLTYHEAQQAVTDYIATTRDKIEEALAQLEERLPTDVAEAGVPAEQLDDELQKLATPLVSIHTLLDEATTQPATVGSMRSLETQFISAKFAIQSALQPLRGRYQSQQSQQPAPTPQPAPAPIWDSWQAPSPDTEPTAPTVLSWQDILGSVQLTSIEDIEQFITRLRQHLTEQLAQGESIRIT